MEITPEQLRAHLARAQYVTTEKVETVLRLALVLGKPLLVEGPAGAGKTELAKVLSASLDLPLVRLQCYEGLDESKALYEWNYQKQLLRIQSEAVVAPGGPGRDWRSVEADVFSREFLLERPLLRAVTAVKGCVLLVDEIDKADEEMEAFLLELLSDFQVTIPELGTIAAATRPIVVLTSNRTRELSEALRRRCLYLWLDFPGIEREREIIALKVPGLAERLQAQVARFVDGLRRMDLAKAPSIAETLDWARALRALGVTELDAPTVRATLGLVLKHEDDQKRAQGRVASLLGPS